MYPHTRVERLRVRPSPRTLESSSDVETSRPTGHGAPMMDPVPFDDSERRFRVAFDRAAVGMCFVALDGRFLEVNARLCAILGYSSDELLATTCIELTHPDDRAREKSMTSRMIAGEIPSATWEKRYVGKDGGTVWCGLTLALVDDESTTLRQFVGVITVDIEPAGGRVGFQR